VGGGERKRGGIGGGVGEKQCRRECGLKGGQQSLSIATRERGEETSVKGSTLSNRREEKRLRLG